MWLCDGQGVGRNFVYGVQLDTKPKKTIKIFLETLNVSKPSI